MLVGHSIHPPSQLLIAYIQALGTHVHCYNSGLIPQVGKSRHSHVFQEEEGENLSFIHFYEHMTENANKMSRFLVDILCYCKCKPLVPYIRSNNSLKGTITLAYIHIGRQTF